MMSSSRKNGSWVLLSGLLMIPLAGCSSVSHSHGVAAHQCDQGCQHDQVVQAGLWGRIKHFWSDSEKEFHTEYRNNVNWPEPYTTLDRQSVRESWDTQAQNARTHMAYLWDYHFEKDTGALNPMGEHRLHRIVSLTKSLGNKIFVRQAMTPEHTDARLKSVNESIESFGLDTESFEIVASMDRPTSVSGMEAQNATRRMIAPQTTSTSGSGSAGGAGRGGDSGAPLN